MNPRTCLHLLLFTWLLALLPSSAQTVLFSEDFSAEAAGATSGTSAEGIPWTATCPGCVAGDIFGVSSFGTIAKGLRGNDTNGPATFSAGGIDANGCFLVVVTFDYIADGGNAGYNGSGNLECVMECGSCTGDPADAVSNGSCNNCWDYLAFRTDTGSGTFSPWTILLGDVCDVPPNGAFTSDPICASPFDMDGMLIPGNDPSNFSFEIEMAMWAGSENMIIDNVTVTCYTEAEAMAAGLAAPATGCFPPPPACAFTAVVSSVSACDPTDNTYSIDIMPTGSADTPAAPANLQVFIDGAATPSATIPAAAATTGVFQVTGLMADGMAHTVTFAWDTGDACTFEVVPDFTAPANCIPVCMVGMVDAQNATCAADFATYSVDVTVQFVNPPATGTLDIDVDGTIVSTALPVTSPFTVNVPGIAPGSAGNVSVTFSADAACAGTTTFTAPDCIPPCSIAPLEVVNIVCATDGTTYDADIIVTFSNPPNPAGNILVQLDGQSMVVPATASPLMVPFTGVPTGGAGVISAQFLNDTPCIRRGAFNVPLCYPVFTIDCPADIVIPNPGPGAVFPGLPSFGEPMITP